MTAKEVKEYRSEVVAIHIVLHEDDDVPGIANESGVNEQGVPMNSRVMHRSQQPAVVTNNDRRQ